MTGPASQRPRDGYSAQLSRLLVLLTACAVVVYRAYGFYPFMADDAFISLRYASRLLQGRGLTWTEGSPVEGYSNLLWTLGCALLGGLGIDLIRAARALGVASTLATIVVMAWALRRRSLLRARVFLRGSERSEPRHSSVRV